MNQEQLAQLHGTLTQALSTQNDVRNAAEKAMAQYLDKHRDLFIAGLMHLLKESAEKEVRSLIAIYLKNNLCRSEPVIFDRTSDQLQNAIKAELLVLLVREPESHVRNLLSDLVCEVAQITLHKNAWPQLLPALYHLSGHQEENLRAVSLSIFGKLTEQTTDSIIKEIPNIHTLIGKGLQDSSLKVQEAACVTACQTILIIDDEKNTTVTKSFQQFTPAIMNILAACLAKNDETKVKNILTGFVTVFSELAQFYRPQLSVMAQAFFQIGCNTSLDDDIRQLCLECFVSASECNAGMVRKSQVWLQNSVQLAFALMLDVDDDDYCEKPENPDAYDDSNLDCGEMALDRLAQSLRGDKMTSIAFPLISQFIGGDWKHRHAALKALAQIAEVMDFKRIPLREVVNFVKDSHPRVRFAAVFCLGELAENFRSEIQHSYHQIFFPCLIDPLGELKYPRIQAYAACAISSLIEGCDESIMDNYIDGLLKVFVQVFEKSGPYVQEHILPAMAAVAGSSPTKMTNYYGALMPTIKHLIYHGNDKQMRMVRARAIEAATFIGMQVGKELFYNDAKEIMQAFLEIMKSDEVAADDTSQQYILQAWSRLCTILGQEFLPVLPVVMPVLFEMIKKKDHSVSIKAAASMLGEVHHGDEGSDFEGDDEEALLKAQGSTSSLDEKALACSVLCSFCSDLGLGFFPYVGPSLELMLPLINYEAHEEVRAYAIQLMPDIMKSVVAALQHQQTQLDFVKLVFDKICGKMLERMTCESELEILQNIVEALRGCISEAGPLALECIDQKGLETIGQALLKLLVKSDERIKGREEHKKDEDYDEETEASLAMSNIVEDELNFVVAECMGCLIKSHKTLFLPVWNVLLPQVVRMLSTQSLPSTVKNAIYLWDDIIEHIQQPAAQYFPQFVPALVTYLEHPQPEIRQPSAYGLAHCAQHGGEAFQPFIQGAVATLIRCLNAPDHNKDDNASASDNMVSALAKIAQYQNQTELYSVWLQHLPINSDKSEHAYNYGLLCSLVEQNSPHLFGPNMQNLPKIVSLLCRLYCDEDVSDDIKARIKGLLQVMKTQLPQEVFSQVLQSVPAQVRENISNVMQSI